MAEVTSPPSTSAHLMFFVDESEDSSSSDDIDFQIAATLGALKQKRTCVENFCEIIEKYSEEEFKSHLRIYRTLAILLIEQFKNSQYFDEKSSISPEKYVYAFLWFAGHEAASIRDVSDRFDVSKSTLVAIITKVMDFLVAMKDEYIKPPTRAEKAMTKGHYENSKGLKNVIGSIDGSHIRIDAPAKRKIDYYNRKSYYSMVLQGVCDHEKKFIDVCVGYPGSVHDARIFQTSAFSTLINEVCEEGEYILGDSAYPLLPNLITPYRDNGHLNARQKKFNKVHSTCRVSIENCFGDIKNRFRQLYHLKLKGAKRISKFIMACCVLHNMATNDGFEDLPGEDEQPGTEENRDGPQPTGKMIRDSIAESL